MCRETSGISGFLHLLLCLAARVLPEFDVGCRPGHGMCPPSFLDLTCAAAAGRERISFLKSPSLLACGFFLGFALLVTFYSLLTFPSRLELNFPLVQEADFLLHKFCRSEGYI